MKPNAVAVHFGAGALGRGLVVPRLAAAGWAVTVADPLVPLVDRLRQRRDYPLRVVSDDCADEEEIGIAAAFVPDRDRAALGSLLAGAELVTTAIKRENLDRLAHYLVGAWREFGMPDSVTLVGCENVEGIDAVLRAALIAASIEKAMLARIRIPATVVDRICAAAWPGSLTVTTEPYSELAIDSRAVPEIPPGMDPSLEIAARFDRKRYLVNTFADASAIIGLGRGYATLAEAVADAAIQAQIGPLLDALIRHLVRRHRFDAVALAAYLATTRKRLANRHIPRRLDTVARDLWRKFEPHERFAMPLIALATSGGLDEASVTVVADLICRAAATEASPMPADALQNRVLALAHLGAAATDAATVAFYRRLAEIVGKCRQGPD